MTKPCDIAPEVRLVAPDHTEFQQFTRRRFLKRAGLTAAALTCADFLGYFATFGLPRESRADEIAKGAAAANSNPHFLIYWYLEGGWCGYDMFNPVMTDNNVINRLDDITRERYRVLKFGQPDYGIYEDAGLRYGYLANPGKDLFKDTAILSSMHTGGGHSSERLKVHMGSYTFRATDERQDDERSVMQAFAEVYGQPYVLPNLSWHWWLSDGELNEVQYTGRRGYYHALGPAHAHTIYAGTPAKLKRFLLKMQEDSGDTVNREIQSFLDSANQDFLKDQNIEAVKSYSSAREIYMQLASKGMKLDRSMLLRLFADNALREEFGVQPADELITYRSVNGNKARSKFTPHSKAQAMMTFELLRAGLSCSFFIESRDIRRFDSHRSRGSLWAKDRKTPIGMTDQTTMMKEDLWDPLHALVARLKNTEYQGSGTSFFDHTNIVLTSEFGRTIHGAVDDIMKKPAPEMQKQKEIDGQDISQHWKVTSAAFLGGKVKGQKQYGGVGETTLLAIPLLPDGSMDPAYDARSGEAISGRTPSDQGVVPNHGDVYATALHLSDIDPKGKGRNERGPLTYIKRA
jgi:hypothetical protein